MHPQSPDIHLLAIRKFRATYKVVQLDSQGGRNAIVPV